MAPSIPPIPPIPPIRALWPKLTRDEELALTTRAMAQAPDAVTSQMRTLLVQIRNVGQVGNDTRSMLAASDRLQQFVNAVEGQVQPSPQCFANQLVDVGHLEEDLRRRLGLTTSGQDVRALQNALATTVRLKRFCGRGND